MKLVGRLYVGDQPTIEFFADIARLNVVLKIPSDGADKPAEVRMNIDELDRMIHGLQCARNHID